MEQPHTRGAGGRAGESSFAVVLLAGLTAAAGVIHSVATPQHFGESALYALFFLIVAVGQLAWGAWVYRQRCTVPPRAVVGGAVANLAVVAIWIVSRTVGLPFGPDPGRPESAGIIDIVATADELAVAVVAIALLRPAGRWGARLAGLSREAQTRVGVALASLTVLGVLLGGHAH